MSDWQKLDDWCKHRADLLADRCCKHAIESKDMDHPGYRMMLGQHQAYMAMRSYIHGAIRTTDPE